MAPNNDSCGPPLSSSWMGVSSGTYDAAAEFSLGQNPNGVWEYGYLSMTAPASSFIAMGFARLENNGVYVQEVWHPSSSMLAPLVAFHRDDEDCGSDTSGKTHVNAHQLSLHPSDPATDYAAAVRWVAPASGDYNVDAAFTGEDQSCGDGVDVRAFRGDNQIGETMMITTVGQKVLVQQSLTGMAAGDRVTFVVGNGTGFSWGCDLTRLEARITRQ